MRQAERNPRLPAGGAAQCVRVCIIPYTYFISTEIVHPATTRKTGCEVQGLSGKARQLSVKLNEIEDRLLGVQARVAIHPGAGEGAPREQLRVVVD